MLGPERPTSEVYAVRFPCGITVPFRLLTNREFRRYLTSLRVGLTPADEIFWQVYQDACLDSFYRENTGEFQAGIPDAVAKAIFYLSGANDLEHVNALLEAERSQVDSVDVQMRVHILMAFPAYTMEALDDLDFPSLIRLYVAAESVLIRAGVLQEPLSLKDAQRKPSSFSFAEAEKEAERVRRL